ncbi:hypothetical protein DTO271D3_3983 [Paecilomyces variotii]|nr:hypothetical protein DTO169E5_1725 [Paecilomyces variotii]KAJ9315727.1 hypothetical protein DTO271D3_3983 [Paecilomyces variotii]
MDARLRRLHNFPPYNGPLPDRLVCLELPRPREIRRDRPVDRGPGQQDFVRPSCQRRTKLIPRPPGNLESGGSPWTLAPDVGPSLVGEQGNRETAVQSYYPVVYTCQASSLEKRSNSS